MDSPIKEQSRSIPLSVPRIGSQEWRYVKECLETGWVSSVGAFVERFERAVAEYAGCAYGVACMNGTSALHTAVMVAGLAPDEEVILPTLTFAAPANAVRYCGAHPVFIDVEPDYWQIDVQKLADFLRKACVYRQDHWINKHTGRAVRGIIPVHVLGHPADMDAVMALAGEFGLWVIEDAAESIGALYKTRRVGAIGHAGCFSFNGNKIITAGGGGMLTTDREDWARRAHYLTTQAKDDPLEYIHQEIGYNYRLTNLQAAVGLAQMESLPGYLADKQAIAARYEQGLRGIAGITLPRQAPWAESTWWLYTVLIDDKVCGAGSREMIRVLAEDGIQARPLWHPLHSLKPFEQSYAFRIEVAPRLYQQALSLPSSVGLSEDDQDRVIRCFRGGLQ